MTYTFALTRPKLFLAGVFLALSFLFVMAGQVSATSQEICPPGRVPDGNGGCKDLETPQYQGPTSGTATIARIINIVLGFLGLVALVLFIIGGFQWMTSGGNEDKTSAAKKLMISAVIGLIIILAAAVISNFAFNAIQKSLGEEGGAGEL